MKAFFEKRKEKLYNLKDMDRDLLMYKVMPHFVLEIIRKYFRLEVEGIENVPHRGRGLIIPNHSGYSGFDAFMLGHEIFAKTKRIPRILAHHLWFITKATAIPLEKMGITEATTANGLQLLKKNNLVILFPEGEYGNFKPIKKKYHLQEFKRGFIRMALLTNTPIIPTVIIGAEETHITVKQLKFTKYLLGTVLPLPLNLIPLPAKWKIRFLPPVHLPNKPELVMDNQFIHRTARDIKDLIQEAITEELDKREAVYFPKDR